MPDDHSLLVDICASVARLQRRLVAAALDRKVVDKSPGAPTDVWRVGDLRPASAWLEGVRPDLAVANVVVTSGAVIQALLTVLGNNAVDRLLVCKLLQRLAVEVPRWTPAVVRLSQRWDVQLPETPLDDPPELPSCPPFRSGL